MADGLGLVRLVAVLLVAFAARLVAGVGGGFAGDLDGGAGLLFRFPGQTFLLGLLGLDLFAAGAVELAQARLFFGVAGFGFLELAQHFLALAGDRRLDVVALDVGALLAHFHGDRGLGLAGTGDRQLFGLAARDGDLLRRAGGLGRRFGLAVRAAQEAEQFDLLGAADDLIGAGKLHAGVGQLLEQLVDRESHDFCQRSYGYF